MQAWCAILRVLWALMNLHANDVSRADLMLLRIRVDQSCPCFSATCRSTHVHMDVVI